MLNFSEISIGDKALFDRYLQKYPPQISELTFTNLFMWRNFYKFRFCEMEGMLCIISAQEGSKAFSFAPIGQVDQKTFAEVVGQIKDYFMSKGWQLVFKRVEKSQLPLFHQIGIMENDMVFDRDSSDYVYLANDLIWLKGKKFDGKRNHINKFRKNYSFEYNKLTAVEMNACYKIMDDWCAQRSCEEHGVHYCEKAANSELLANYDVLGCVGALIKVDGEFQAFTVGEMLNEDTVVIHIEKANGQIQGLYTLINQQFCLHEWQEATFVNREQDLGIEGLRKAKLSYNPVKIIEKYTVIIR